MKTSAWIGAALGLALGVLAPRAARADERLDLGSGVLLDLVPIPAMTFDQGLAEGAPLHAPDEGARRVTLSKAYFIGRTLVTVAQWRRFASATSYRTEAEVGQSGGFGWTGDKLEQRPGFDWKAPGFAQTDTDPVVLVTFADASAFTQWAGLVANRTVRLPTEAEWEAAAKGTTTTRFFWGDAEGDVEKWAWFGKNADHRTHPVGEKPANPLGLADAVGNVWQWTGDGYGEITTAPVTDPRVDVPKAWARSDKPRRVLKGGSWNTNDRAKLRPAARLGATDGSRNADFGFRIVVEAGAGTRGPTPTDRTPPSKPTSRPPIKPVMPPAPPRASSGSSFPWLVVVAGGGLAVIFAIILAARRKPAAHVAPAKRGRRPQLAPGSPYRARLAPDGFWLEAPDAPPGTDIPYVARVKGKSVRGQARVSGSQKGTFVYTGAQPNAVDFPVSSSDTSSSSYFSGSATPFMHDPHGHGHAHGGSSHAYDTSSTTSYDSSSTDGGGSGWPSAY